MLEKTLQRKIIKLFKNHGILTRKLDASNHRGWPDLIAIKGGVVVFIEVKTLTGRVSRLQAVTHAELAEHGASVEVVRNLEEASKIIFNYFT